MCSPRDFADTFSDPPPWAPTAQCGERCGVCGVQLGIGPKSKSVRAQLTNSLGPNALFVLAFDPVQDQAFPLISAG